MASKATLVWYGFWKLLIKAEIPFTIVKLSYFCFLFFPLYLMQLSILCDFLENWLKKKKSSLSSKSLGLDMDPQ